MRRPVWFFTSLGVLLLVWSLTPFWLPHVARWFLISATANEQGAAVNPGDHAISGQFGDMFGAINSLFSGIALIGVAYGLYLQVEQKRREKQPEVFARLAAKDNERQLVLAPLNATPAGEVYLTLAVPIYITTGSSAAAFNVEVSVAYGSLAYESRRLPVPVLSNTDPQNEVIQLQINANRLAGALPGWRQGPGNEHALGELEVKIEFENQQRAKWEITAKYKISSRTAADSNSLEAWIHNATTPTDDTRSIELESSAISWTPKEL